MFVGDVDIAVHPMKASVNGSEPHWVTHIYVVNQDNKVIAMESLDPTFVDVAAMEFDIPPGVTSVKAYEFCNIHGLWEGPSVKVQKAAEADKDTEDQKAADKNGDVKDLEKAESGASRTSNMVLTGLLLSIFLSMS